MKRDGAVWLLGVATLGCLVLVVPSQRRQLAGAQQTDFERIQASCTRFDSYFVTSIFAEATSAQPKLTGPAILAFHDRAAGNDGAPITLARQDQVGAVYGLAYDAVHRRLYAAAYHKRATAFGPGGPGQIYEIDLASGNVRPFVRLVAGMNRHDYRTLRDEPAAGWVGRTGLGDLEVDEAGRQLFAMNLSDGRIYRIGLPDGMVLGSFRHGADGEPWVRSAQPFGLAYADGWLYHGVVNSIMFGGSPDELKGYVYRSRPDGSELSRMAEFDLSYPRGFAPSWDWRGWDNWVAAPLPSGAYPVDKSQPILADLELPVGGALVVGLRDRMTDMLPVLDRPTGGDRGVGDLLLGQPQAAGWRILTEGEHFSDDPVLGESMWGSLASLPGFPIVVGASLAPMHAGGLGALWYWLDSGDIANAETLTYTASGSNGLGDVESLCPRRSQPDPGAVPTATSRVATATAAAPATATALALTPLPPGRVPARFDRLVAESCEGDNPYAATVCHPLAWPWLPGVPITVTLGPVVAFRDTPENQPVYVLSPWEAVGSVWGLAYRSASGTVYAAAYLKRLAGFGSLGTGGIYWIDIATGHTAPFAVVPHAGLDLHLGGDMPDTRARDGVGKLSLGDIDLSEDETTLFVVNLYDRRIYRFAAESGTLLGSFDHGAARESWAPDARPFALKSYRGRLYHGVVNSAEHSQRQEDLWAHVYESWPDGTGTREVVRVPLGYERGTVHVPGVLGGEEGDLPLAWRPWRDGENDLSAARMIVSIYPQPMLTDIEFRANGDMILGLRDRHADMAVGTQIQGPTIVKPGVGFGDVLLVPWRGDGWGDPVFDHFQNLGGSGAARAGMGGLAGWLPFPQVLVNRVAFSGAGIAPWFVARMAREVLWFDGQGNPVRLEELCQSGSHGWPLLCGGEQGGGPGGLQAETARPWDDEFIPSSSMGDVELLCGPAPPPTLSPTPRTATAQPSRTSTASSTPTPSCTPTPSATPRPRPIYLPIAIRIPCVPTGQYSDVALVIDVSTSMNRPTVAGRTKLDATIEAAKWFIDRMEHLAPDALGHHEQVAVVGFNRTAWIQQGLTNDRDALHQALDQLAARVAEYTRLDLAVSTGALATDGRSHHPANGKVIILLTDGLPNQVPLDPDGTMETTVRKAAQAAKDDGNRIYTIAIGAPADTNPELLRAMASAPDHYFYMPDPEELESVYGAIYVSIPCAGEGAHWP